MSSSNATPSLTLGGTLNEFVTVFGTASAAQNFSVAGTDLTSDALEVLPPAGYEVSLSPDFSTGTGTLLIPLNLGADFTANTSVFIRLAADNPVGSLYTGDVVVRGGGASQQTLSISSGTVLADIPGAPSLGTVTAGVNQLTVAFTPPTSDGGSAITNYEYSIDGEVTYTALLPAQTSGPLVISGLNAGVAYTVRIRAVNAAGSGPASNSGSGTPTAPSGSSVVVGGTNVTFTGMSSFTMEFVGVDNPQNPADALVTFNGVTFTTNFFGAVPNSFRMAKFEVTRGMIQAFDPMMNMSAAPGANTTNHPATGLSWNHMARFVNWMNTNRGHSPAYKFSSPYGSMTANDSIQMWSPGEAGYNPANPFRNANAVYVLPSEDEWFKAAYHGGTNRYWRYATGSDSDPARVASGTNGAVYSDMMNTLSNPAVVTQAGGPSFYGTVGQGGNVAEMTESSLSRTNNAATNNRIFRGGSWANLSFDLQKATRNNTGLAPTTSTNNVGFRVAQLLPVASAPTIVSITPGDRQLSVLFTPPTSDAGSAISNYQYSIDGGTTFAAFSPAQTNSPLVISGLTNGTTYTVRIEAVTGVGPGLDSNSGTGTPVAPPTLNLYGGLPPTIADPVTLTHTNSFSMPTSTNRPILTFPKFNPGLGTLTGVGLDFQGSVTNQSDASAPEGFAIGRYESLRPINLANPERITNYSTTLSATFTNLASGQFISTKILTDVVTPSLPQELSMGMVRWFKLSTAQAYPTFSQTNVMTKVGTNVAQSYFTGATGSVSMELFHFGNFSSSGTGTAPLTRELPNSSGTISLNYTYQPPPVSRAAPLTNFTTTYGTASLAQTFTVNGSSLNGSEVTLRPPAGFELSLNENFSGTVGTHSSPLSLGTPTTIPDTVVHVRLAATTGGGFHRGNISIAGGGAPLRSLAIVSGTVNRAVAATPSGTITLPGLMLAEVTTAVGSGGSGSGVFQYRIKDSVESVVILANNGAIRAVGVGDVEIEVRRAGDQNYEDSEWVSAGLLTVAGAPATPSLTLGSLSDTGTFTTTYGTPSAAQSFTIVGSDLDGTPVTVTPPAGYEVSLDENFGSSSASLNLDAVGGTINTTVYIRLASGNPVGVTYTGNITVGGGGVSDQTIAITGGTVTKGAQSALVASLTDNSLRIGEGGSVVLTGGSGSGDYEYQVKGGGTNVVTIAGGGAYTGVGVGTAEIEVRKLGDETYETTAWLTVNDIITVSQALQAPVSGLLADLTLKVGQATSVTASGGSGTGAYEYRVVGSGSTFVTVGSDGTITTVSAGTAEIEVRRLGDATYEDSGWVSAGTVTVNALSPLLGAVGPLTSFSTTVGTASAAQSFTVDGEDLNGVAVTVAPPEGYEVSLTPDFATIGTNGSPLTLSTSTSISPTLVYVRLAATAPAGTTYSGDILVSGGGATAQRVSIPGGTVSATPSLTLGSLSGGGTFTASYGTNSVAQSFTITGSNLDPVNFVSVTPPLGYEVSLDPDFVGTVGTSGAPLQVGTATGEVSAPIYVRLSSNNPVGATYTGNITVSGGGVSSDRTIAVTGEVTKAAQAPLVASLNKDTLVIGEDGSVSVSGGSGFGEYEYRILDETSDVVSLTGGGFYSGAGVGSKVVQVRRTGDANYLDTDWVTVGTVTVSKATQIAVTGFLSEVSVEVGQTAYVIGDGGSGTGIYEYRIKDDVTGVVTLGADGTITTVGTGSVVIEVRKLGDGTYEDSEWVVAGTLTVTAPPADPSLTLGETLSSFTASFGTNSVAQTFTVSGSNLDGTSVAVIAPPGYELSLTEDFGSSSNSLFLPVGDTLENTTIYIRLSAGNTVGTGYTGNIEVSGAGVMTPQTIAVTGEVTRADQTITFEPLADRNFDVGSFNLTATASSLLPVSYTSSNTNVATIFSGDQVIFHSAGTTTITASQAGDSSYNPAADVGRTLTILAVVPWEPFLDSVTPGNGELSVNFTPPSYTGGAPIINYEYSLDNGVTFLPITPTDTTSPLVITGLTNGTDYTVKIRAVNSAGAGAASNPYNGRPMGIPALAASGTFTNFVGTYPTNMPAQSFTVSGSNLNGMDEVKVIPPVGFEVSATEDFSGDIGTAGLGLSLGYNMTISNNLYVRLVPWAYPGAYSGNIVVSGGGATNSPSLAVTGTLNKRLQDPLTLSLSTNSLTVPNSGYVFASGGSTFELFEFRVKGGGTNVVTVTSAGEILSQGGGTAEIEVRRLGDDFYEDTEWISAGSVTVNVPATPSLTLGSWSVDGNFTAAYGTNSIAQSFTLTGSNLDPVNFVYVTPPVGYEVSLDKDFVGTVGTSGAPLQVGTATGEVSTTVYVRLASGNPVADTYTGTITVGGGGVSDQTIAITGEVTKAAQDPLVANLSNNTLVIGEGGSVTVSGGSGFGEYEYRILDETSDVVSLTGGGFYSGAGVGSKVVQVRKLGDESYLETDWVTVGTVTVSKSTQLTVTGSLSDLSVEVGQTASVTGGGGSGTGIFEYRIKDDVTGVVTLGADGTITTVGTGSVVIEVRKLGDGTYEDSEWVVAGTLTVTAPASSILAANDTVDRDGVPGSMTSILIAELLTNDTYAGPGAPTVTLPSGTTAQGGTVTIDNGWILYTSAGSLAASDTDSFTYQIDDGTGTSTATVTLVAGDYSATAVNIVWVKDANSPQTGKDVNFAVTPNRYYRIYATSSLTAPILWQDLGNGSVYGGGVSGSIILNDPGAGSSRFYKLEEYRP